MMMTCIIVDDEPLARRKLEQYVAKIPELNLLQSLGSALEAISYLQQHPVDLLLLDIRMDDLTGIELLEALQQRPEVILCTAYEQYALRGFELRVADYLLKPYSFNRFLQAVLTVQSRLQAGQQTGASDLIFIRTEHRLQKVWINEILFIEGMGDYRRIHCLERKIMTLETFGDLEKKLPGNLFCRVHKSFLIAIARIESIERDRIKIGTDIIPISETYRRQFYRTIR